MSPLNKDKRWEGRPWAARLIKFIAFAGPLIISVLATIWISRQLPPPESFGAAVGAWILLGIIATIIVQVLDRLARKLLPLAALLQLSLAFPGSVPSRYKVARGRGGSRELQAEVDQAREHGLSSDRTDAAVTVLRLVAALSTHDKATRGHAERVRVFVDMIAEEMDIIEVAEPLRALEAAVARDPDSKEATAALDAALKKLVEVTKAKIEERAAKADLKALLKECEATI